MIKKIFTLFAMLISLAAFAQTQSTTPHATAYKDEGFRGESEKFLIGEYPKMENGWKDEIKSLTLNGGVRVTLFDKEKFEGKKLVVESSMYKLGDFNEKAASMIVEAFACQFATAYKETAYRGNPKQFTVGKYEELKDGWDDMKSVDLCGSVTVTVYKKKNFEGESMKVDRDRMDLGKFSKNVKSMVVEAAAATTTP